MARIEGMEMKFTVLKNEDLDGVFLTYPELRDPFEHLCNKVQQFRLVIRKPAKPTYLVINTDEKYADEVIDILKRNGHWSKKGDTKDDTKTT